MLDPNEILLVRGDDQGIEGVVTHGSLAAEKFIRQAVSLLRALAPVRYEEVRRLLRDDGESREQVRKEAFDYAVMCAWDFAINEHYPSLWFTDDDSEPDLRRP